MASKYINRELIEGILSEDVSDFIENLSDKVNGLVSLAMNDLASKNPYINFQTAVFQPINETFNSCYSPLSNLEYFVGIHSPQIERNCLDNSNWFNKLKDDFVIAWRRTRKKKRKSKAEKNNPEGKVDFTKFDGNKYNLDSFKKDLQIGLINNLSETSLVYNLSDRLILQGRDDLGSVTKVILYPVLCDNGVFKYFINRRKGFLKIDINARTENFNAKYEKVGDNLFITLKILNVLYTNICKEHPNQIFMESLVCGIPDEIYLNEEDPYNLFIKVINYLKMSDASTIKSIENPAESIFRNVLTKDSLPGYLKFIKALSDD